MGVLEAQSTFTLEYQWAEPTTVNEFFFLLTKASPQTLRLEIEMTDSEQTCETPRGLLESGYIACREAIRGKVLLLTFMNESDQIAEVSIAALNIFEGRNLVTQQDSKLSPFEESPRKLILYNFEDNFNRQSSPRETDQMSQCLTYYRNTVTGEFPFLTLDLGKLYHLEAIQVMSMAMVSPNCGMASAMYLSGLKVTLSSNILSDENAVQCNM